MSTFTCKQKFILQIVMISILAILAGEPRDVLSQSTHNDFTAVAISPDGTKIVGGGSNGLLRLWDVSTGQVLQDYSGVTQSITSVAWSPDGSRIASGGSDTAVRVWDLNGTLLASMNDHNTSIMSVAWSSDGTYLASAGFTGLDDYSLRIWDGTTYSLLQQYSAGSINSLAWHPNRHEIALAGENGFVYTVTISSLGVEYTGVSYENPTAMVSVAWNSDGTRLATGDAIGNIKVWNPMNFDNIGTLIGHTNYVEALVWSPDDTKLASASADGTVRTWDVTSGENIDIFQNSKVTITTSIDWDGDLLSFGQANAQIKMVYFPTADAGPDQTLSDSDNSGSEFVTLDAAASSDPDGSIVSYVWSEYGAQIATEVSAQVDLGVGVHVITLAVTDDDGATAVDELTITVEAADACVSHCVTGRAAEADTTASQPLPNEILAVAWSPDGNLVAGGGLNGLLRIWDASTGEVLQDFPGIQWAVFSVAWSPDGTRIASGGGDNIIRVWDISGTLLASIDDHGANITSVAWNADGSLLASASHTGLEEFHLRIWDGNTYLPITEDRAGDINGIAWNPNPSRNELAVAKQNYFLTLETITATEIQFSGLSFENASAMTSVAWNSDGSLLASGDVIGNINIWNPANLTNIITLTEHTDVVSALVWSPDDQQLASASGDGTLRIWDVASGQTTATLTTSTALRTTAIDWNTTGLIFGRGDGTVEIIHFPTADAGPDQTLTDSDNSGSERVTLDAAASSDPDGTLVSYVWSGNGAQIATGGSPQVDLGVGVHSITLTVADDDGATAVDELTITVEAADAPEGESPG